MADWYPYSRDDQLHLTKTWNNIFVTSGYTWGIPPDRMTQLQTDTSNAQIFWDKVKSGDRSAQTTAECNILFQSMETEARFIKKHYLLMPPLTLVDFATLLLDLPDSSKTPVPKPTGQVVVTITYPGGPHILAVHFAALLGTEPPDRRGDYGFALYRGIMPQGGATLEQAASVKHYLMKEPLSGDELMHYRFTRRKKELVTFDASEAGMRVFFCARYENQKGEHGEWGPIATAIIP
jgi:hypothetical protein